MDFEDNSFLVSIGELVMFDSSDPSHFHRFPNKHRNIEFWACRIELRNNLCMCPGATKLELKSILLLQLRTC